MAFELWLRRRMSEYEGVGVDVKEFAQRIGKDPVTVGRWLAGDVLPNREAVLKIAQFFHTSPATILRQTDPEEFMKLTQDEARQTVEADALVEEVARLLRSMSPERRAAWLMLMRTEPGEES